MMKCSLKNQIQRGTYVSIWPQESQKLNTPLGQLLTDGNMSPSGLQPTPKNTSLIRQPPTHKNTSFSGQPHKHKNTSLSRELLTHRNTSPSRQVPTHRNQPLRQSLGMKFRLTYSVTCLTLWMIPMENLFMNSYWNINTLVNKEY